MPRQRRGLQTPWIRAASNSIRGTHQPTTSPAVAACASARNQTLAYQHESASDAKLAVASHDLPTRMKTEVGGARPGWSGCGARLLDASASPGEPAACGHAHAHAQRRMRRRAACVGS